VVSDALVIEGADGVVDRLVECVGVGESLVGEMMRLEVAPDEFDVVQFGCVFGQPLDGEPMCAGGVGCERAYWCGSGHCPRQAQRA
jgi:hypothetical protein